MKSGSCRSWACEASTSDPGGSTIAADGEGFTFQGHTLRLRDEQDDHSGGVGEPAEIDHSSPALKVRAPKHVENLQGPG